jgi:hypothetical protein
MTNPLCRDHDIFIAPQQPPRNVNAAAVSPTVASRPDEERQRGRDQAWSITVCVDLTRPRARVFLERAVRSQRVAANRVADALLREGFWFARAAPLESLK